MEPDARTVIASVRNSHERLVSLVKPLTPQELRRRSYASEWSIAQVLSHLGSQAEIFETFLAAALRTAMRRVASPSRPFGMRGMLEPPRTRPPTAWPPTRRSCAINNRRQTSNWARYTSRCSAGKSTPPA